MATLANQVAFVSGGSIGIGRAVVEALAQRGVDVAINFNSHSDEAAALADLVRGEGRKSLLLPGDVADCGAVERMIEAVVSEYGRLDIVVSNAAYNDRGLFHEIDMASFRRTIDVTMWGSLYVLRAAARQMIAQQRGGAIVCVSSPHAYLPIARAMPYNMAKAALDQMARTAALELAPHRIRVNLVYPGWTDTPGERKFFDDEQLSNEPAKLPSRRLAQPAEIARAILFLCDPESDYIIGSSLLIDGGYTLPWWNQRI